MDTRTMEMAADIVFRMCRAHPEICPHNYEWTREQQMEGHIERHYECTICGDRQTRKIPITIVGHKEKTGD